MKKKIIPTKIKKSYCYVPNIHTRTVECPQCGQTIEVPVEYIEYIYDGKRFCSWSCKCKYKKEHLIEELTSSEYVLNKWLNEKKKAKERYKNEREKDSSNTD